MKSYWCICVDATGTKWLEKGKKYLIEPRGAKARIIRDGENPHRRYGRPVNKDRFKLLT